MTDSPEDERIPRVSVNKAWLRVGLGAAVVVSLALICALLAQDGLFTSDPGRPDHPDGLTTLALVLAVLAFLVQIFVFFFQMRSDAAAVERSEELNSRTHALLRKIEADSAATQGVLFAQFNRLLDFIVGKPSSRNGEIGIDDADVADLETEERAEPATVADVQKALNEALRVRERPVFEAQTHGAPSAEDRAVLRYLRSWPTREEAEVAAAELAVLSPLAIAAIVRLASTEKEQRRDGDLVGLPWGGPSSAAAQSLLSAGIVTADGQRARLTEKGRRLARVLPIGKPSKDRPDWWEEATALLNA